MSRRTKTLRRRTRARHRSERRQLVTHLWVDATMWSADQIREFMHAYGDLRLGELNLRVTREGADAMQMQFISDLAAIRKVPAPGLYD